MWSPTRRDFGLLTLGGAAASLMKGAAARAAAPDRIHIGFLPLASHAPTFIAMEKGYFTNAGLDAELVPDSQFAVSPGGEGAAGEQLDRDSHRRVLG